MTNNEIKPLKARISAYVLTSILLSSGSLAAAQLTEAQAKHAAQERFVQACSHFKCKAAAFTGPQKVTVDGATFAYQWKNTAKSAPEEIQVYMLGGGWVTTVKQ
jgi:uncharacterized membrane-anchored protein